MNDIISKCTRKPNKETEFICEDCNKSFILRRSPKKDQKHLCKSCLRIASNARCRQAQYHKNPKYRLKARRWQLENRYNLSLDEYDSLFEQQKGVCAICNLPNDNNRPLVVDHSHINNKVRGLLCDKCNRAIGALNDDISLLQKAITYLNT